MRKEVVKCIPLFFFQNIVMLVAAYGPSSSLVSDLSVMFATSADPHVLQVEVLQYRCCRLEVLAANTPQLEAVAYMQDTTQRGVLHPVLVARLYNVYM